MDILLYIVSTAPSLISQTLTTSRSPLAPLDNNRANDVINRQCVVDKQQPDTSACLSLPVNHECTTSERKFSPQGFSERERKTKTGRRVCPRKGLSSPASSELCIRHTYYTRVLQCVLNEKKCLRVYNPLICRHRASESC